MNTESKIHITTIRLPVDILEGVDEVGEYYGMSRNRAIGYLLAVAIRGELRKIRSHKKLDGELKRKK